jgi:hypothetical protein
MDTGIDSALLVENPKQPELNKSQIEEWSVNWPEQSPKILAKPIAQERSQPSTRIIYIHLFLSNKIRPKPIQT